MNTSRLGSLSANIYLTLCIIFMILPLAIMAGAAFNDSRFPSVYPWRAFTLRWFVELWNDPLMLSAALNTLLVALVVVAMALPIGTAAALLLNSLRSSLRPLIFGVLIAPLLTPGVVVGISTLLFWQEFGVSAGLHLSTLGQVSYIATYVMLLVLARLQGFDRSLEEAALDLGASHAQVMRRVVLPHLYPVLLLAAVLAFFQSVENYNITLFTRGNSQTLTVYVGSMVRTGFTPAINALATIFITMTIVGVVAVELRRRRLARRERELERLASLEEEREVEGLRAA